MRCEVRIASLDDMIYQYIALSYCWGDPEPFDKLWYNDDNYFELSKSLSLILGWLTSFPNWGTSMSGSMPCALTKMTISRKVGRFR